MSFAPKGQGGLENLSLVLEHYDYEVSSKEDVLNKVLFIKTFHEKYITGETKRQKKKAEKEAHEKAKKKALKPSSRKGKYARRR